MKYILILSLLLTGCGAYVTNTELEEINTICEHNGGFNYAHMALLDEGNNEIHCTDGAVFELVNKLRKG